MHRLIPALAAVLVGCSLMAPDEHWCATTTYWSLTDSVVATDSLGDWYAAEPEPDSVATEWSVDGECTEYHAMYSTTVPRSWIESAVLPSWPVITIS